VPVAAAEWALPAPNWNRHVPHWATRIPIPCGHAPAHCVGGVDFRSRWFVRSLGDRRWNPGDSSPGWTSSDADLVAPLDAEAATWRVSTMSIRVSPGTHRSDSISDETVVWPSARRFYIVRLVLAPDEQAASGSTGGLLPSGDSTGCLTNRYECVNRIGQSCHKGVTGMTHAMGSRSTQRRSTAYEKPEPAARRGAGGGSFSQSCSRSAALVSVRSGRRRRPHSNLGAGVGAV
jgi:hypothetical protein